MSLVTLVRRNIDMNAVNINVPIAQRQEFANPKTSPQRMKNPLSCADRNERTIGPIRKHALRELLDIKLSVADVVNDAGGIGTIVGHNRHGRIVVEWWGKSNAISTNRVASGCTGHRPAGALK